jgi:hypothetical protein
MSAVPSTVRAGTVRTLIGLGRSIVAAAFCAQLAHAVVYGSLLPTAGVHGYLIWYVPTLAVASVVALALVPASIAASALASGRRSFGAILPERRPGRAARDVFRLALSAAVFFFVQESLETTAETGGIQVATFPPLTLLVLVLVLVLVAAAVVAVERTLEDLAERFGVTARPRARLHWTWTRRVCAVARPHPLAVHGGLRAPPVTV